jgi:hypothetical protein
MYRKMTKYFKLLILLITGVFIFGCSSDKECVKTITMKGITIVTPTGTSVGADWTQEVPCDYEITPIKEVEPLKNFSYEVLSFNFTPDTGKNTNRLQFEIKLNNLNDFDIKGYPMFTVIADGIESSGPYSKGAISTCNQIEKKSSCIFTFDVESSLELGKINSIKLVTVNYYLLN